MQILSVTLTNFKSHRDRHFQFQPGTNAICGENGAGKTSILEAIAWVLFDYTGDYTKEDLICNGAGSAQARVSFVSSRDARTYEVQRCTSKGYTLFDPQLNQRLHYSRIKEEVLPWLRQQLGVAPGTDLEQLFSSTIGVPQGTFTADFQLTRERRKPIFDKILKVEEYQQTWKKLADLEKYSKAQVESLEREINRTDEELQRLAEIPAKRDRQDQEITRVETEIQQLDQQRQTLEQQVTEQETQQQQLQSLEQHVALLEQQLQTQTQTLENAQLELQQAEHAAAICTANREAYQAFLQAEEQLRELEAQRRQEAQLQQQKRQQEKLLGDRHTELATLTLQLNQLADAQAAIAQLQPLASQQRELEHQLQSLNQQLQTLQAQRQTLKTHTQRQTQLQKRQTQLEQEIATIQALAASVHAIPDLEQQQQRLQQQLSRLAAATQFAADLRQLCDRATTAHTDFHQQVQHATASLRELQTAVPLWHEVLETILTTLTTGTAIHQDLMAHLNQILNDITAQTDAETLTQQLQSVTTQLQTARSQQAKFANLERLLTERTQIVAEAHELHNQIAQTQTQLAAEPNLRSQIGDLTQALTALDNPIARIQVYQRDLQQEANLRQQQQAVATAIQTITTAIAAIDQQLVTFADLNAAVARQQTQRDEHRPAYETYMAQRELANTRKARSQTVDTATAAWQQTTQTYAAVVSDRDRLRQTLDPLAFANLKAQYQAVRDAHNTLSGSLPALRHHWAELDQQMQHVEHLQQQQQTLKTQLDHTKKTDRWIKFARKTYKEAGPRITERYIQQIAVEADRLFRELLNRPNLSLTWTRDYEIIVQEGAHSRRFANLSGGEQMCAALAVRLALLKVLADIDIAFFDEPTTNMDRPRRIQLAEAIANIKTFRQLFVISHDDTFETITENIILVERSLD